MISFQSTKIIELGSCAFRQPLAQSHCKLIHGYYLSAKFTFECKELDQNNWVVDFGALKAFREILEKQFDHTLCIASTDPLIEDFKKLHTAGGCDLRIFKDGVGIERFAEYCLKVANVFVEELTNKRCWCSQVEVWEHGKNSAICNLVSKKTKKETSEILPKTELPSVKQAEPQPAVKSGPPGPIPAAVGPQKTSRGWSDPFQGTSWGHGR